VSPVKYELGFYIPEDDILHSHRREDLKSYKLEYKVEVSDSMCMLTAANIDFCIGTFQYN
jgi:hypothetical protein